MRTNIAVVGSGYMGGGIAQVFALAGARVALSDVSADIAQTNVSRLIERSAELVAYRNRAFVLLQKLIDELGPAPIH